MNNPTDLHETCKCGAVLDAKGTPVEVGRRQVAFHKRHESCYTVTAPKVESDG